MRCFMSVLLLTSACAGVVNADEVDSLRAVVTDSQDPAVRRDAIEKLQDLGSPAVPALRQLLAHSEPVVRVLVLQALGNMSARQSDPERHPAWEAVPDMIRLLEDQDVRVRQSAAVNLGWFWGPPGEGPRRDEVAKSAVPKLVLCLRDEDRKLREYAARLLWRIADVAWEAVPALTDALDDEDVEVRSFARRTLLRLGPPERAYTVRQLQEVLDAQPAAPDLLGIRASRADSEVRGEIGLSRFEALTYLGRKTSVPEAMQLEPLLLGLAADDNPAIRFSALATRAKLGLAEESPVALLETALGGDDSNTAFWAAHALVELQGAEAHQAVGILAAAIPEHRPVFSRKGPTQEQILANLKADIAIASLKRLDVRIPTSE